MIKISEKFIAIAIISIVTLVALPVYSAFSVIDEEKTYDIALEGVIFNGSDLNHEETEFISNELLIKFKNGTNLVKWDSKISKNANIGIPSIDTLNKKHNVKKIEKVFNKTKAPDRDANILRWYKITLSNKREIIKTKSGIQTPEEIFLKGILNEYLNDPNIENVEFNYILKATKIPNDPYYLSSGSWGQPYDDLYGLKKINSEQAWNITMGSPSVIVAVIDTGIDYNHPDLSGNVWRNVNEIPNNRIDDDNNGYIDDYMGWDFINNDNDPIDDNGHGTHVAGTISAIGNNNIGVVGIGWNLNIMPLKFLNSGGSGSTSDAAKAMQYAVDNGARVSSNSYGGGGNSKTFEDIIDYASERMVIVAAAGNDNKNSDSIYPAAYTNVMSVSAFDYNDKKASFSNWGDIDVAAPGVNILSLKSSINNICEETNTIGINYCILSGTSMATPHVAGLVGLVLSYHPELSSKLTRFIIEASADDLEDQGFDIYSGHGRINSFNALLKADEVINNPKPELLIGKIETSKSIAAPNSPIIINITIENIGQVNVNNVWVRLFNGNPDVSPGGIPLGFWTLSIPARSSQTVQTTINIMDRGKYELYATVDRENVHDEFSEFNNKKVKSLIISKYEFGRIYQISSDASEELFPRISGDRIVWRGDSNDPQGDNIEYMHIYLYDLGPDGIFGTNDCQNGRCEGKYQIATSGVQINPLSSDFLYPPHVDISNELIVWEDTKDGNWEIYLYDLGPDGIFGTNDCQNGRCEGEFRITTDSTDQRNPEISGNKIVWEGSGIWLRDIPTSQSIKISGFGYNPAIEGNNIVYESGNDIYYYDVNSGGTQKIPIGRLLHLNPDISSGIILWEDWQSGEGKRIYSYNITNGQEKRLSSKDNTAEHIATDTNKAVWRYKSDGIYLYDFTEQLERKVVRMSFNNHPAISDDTIVWESLSSLVDIFMTKLDFFPSPPNILTTTQIGQTVELDWTDNNEIDFNSYSVYRTTESSPGALYPYKKIADKITESSFIDNNLLPDTEHFYRVTALDNANGESGYSNIISLIIGKRSKIINNGNSNFEDLINLNLQLFENGAWINEKILANNLMISVPPHETRELANFTNLSTFTLGFGGKYRLNAHFANTLYNIKEWEFQVICEFIVYQDPDGDFCTDIRALNLDNTGFSEGRIDGRDLSVLVDAWGAIPGAPNWNKNADFNRDKIINDLDKMIMDIGFGRYI